MTNLRSVLLMLMLGTLGAVLSVAVLLVIPTDGGPLGYKQLLANDLPVLIFAIGSGFLIGVLIAALWPVLQWLFEVRA